MYPNDCPRCGKKASAWGDGFCGKCEVEFREEMARQEEIENEPYLRRWGVILYIFGELGANYFQKTIDEEIKVVKDSNLPEYTKKENVRALTDAITQYQQTGNLKPPERAKYFIPEV